MVEAEYVEYSPKILPFRMSKSSRCTHLLIVLAYSSSYLKGGSSILTSSLTFSNHTRSSSVTSISRSYRIKARSPTPPALPSMAAVSTAPGLPSSSLQFEAESLSTLPDPRSPDDFQSLQERDTPFPHPDLNNEVATLSKKLISAINHQTNLDDILAATRQELETSQKRVHVLELENRKHTSLIESGFLVKKSEAEEQASKLVVKLAEERKRRTVVEKDKKGIEQELENLTTALFEEANEV